MSLERKTFIRTFPDNKLFEYPIEKEATDPELVELTLTVCPVTRSGQLETSYAHKQEIHKVHMPKELLKNYYREQYLEKREGPAPKTTEDLLIEILENLGVLFEE